MILYCDNNYEKCAIMTEKEIKIGSNKLNLTVNPSVGGVITSFTYKGSKGEVKVLRSADEAKLKKEGANAASGFAMIPYSDKIKDSAFVYWGIKRNIHSNEAGDPMNGDGWKKSWNVDEASADKVKMSYKHDGKSGFPYPYSAEQTIEVKDNIVRVTLTATNDFELPMPVGFGYTPFFPKTDDVEICCKNKSVWSHEGFMSIGKPYKTPIDWSFEEIHPLGDTEFDTCFGGFDGKITIKYPTSNLKIEINGEDDFHHLFMYHKKGDDYFTVAPSTNVQDAFNLAARGIIGSGIKTLESGETCSEVIEFKISEE